MTRRSTTRVLALLAAIAAGAGAVPSANATTTAPAAHSIAEPAPVAPFPVGNHQQTLRSRADAVHAGPQPCTGSGTISAAQTYYGFGYLANQIAQAYDLTPFYQQGDEGQGQTIALLELEPNSATDIDAYQGCYGTHTTVNYIPVDGGLNGDGTVDTTDPGTGEAALDIEQIIGLAPQATIDVYQAPNTADGILAAYQAIVANPAVAIISTSWGACEPNNPIAQLEEAIFAQAAQNGVSVLAAAGDQGSTDCGTSSLAVDDPASDPYVTGVGGTTLPNPAAPGEQFAWNGSSINNGVTGGGYSSLWNEPPWQDAAAQTAESAAAAKGQLSCPAAASGGYCRAVPDVSADADPYTGYYIYLTQNVYNSSTGQTSPELTAEPWGGTSAAAPLWAAVTALINASKDCNGHNLGFLNPLLYQAAVTGLPGLTDITSGNNNNTADNPSVYYTATTGYDPVTGLGTPLAATLGQSLCATADTLTLSAPSIENSSYAQNVDVTNISATDAQGHALTYTASGLPAGLAINPATGTITGQPTANSNSTVRITVTAADNNASKTTITHWTVTGAPASTSTTTTPTTSTPPATTPAPTQQPSAGSGQGKVGKSAGVTLTRHVDGQTITVTIPAGQTYAIVVHYLLRGRRRGQRLQTVELTAIATRGSRRHRKLSSTSRRDAGALTLKLRAGEHANTIVLAFTYTFPHGRSARTPRARTTVTLNLSSAVRRAQALA